MPELPDYSLYTEEELRREMNLPVSDGEKVLSAKSGEWALAGDLPKALDCARASLMLYQDRMARREAAKREFDMRKEDAFDAALMNAAKTASLL